MKIRQGFVSNSSSSSFILSKNDYKSTVEIALAFINDSSLAKLNKENEDNAEYLKTVIANLQKQELNFNKPIFISRLCYENFSVMRNRNKDYYVHASRHVDWTDINMKSNHNEDEFYKNFGRLKELYLPQYDLYGKQTYEDMYYTWCDKCHSSIFKINNFVQCPVCRTNKEGKLDPTMVRESRENKLKRVLKKLNKT